MKENLLAILVLCGFLIVPVIVLLVFMHHDAWVRGNQECIREDRASLLAALENIQSGASLTNYDRSFGVNSWCQPFLAKGSKYASVINIGDTNYQCILATDEYVGDRGWLGVTTNKVVIWLDRKRAPKIITDSYKVPGWWSGY
jgi:hypothetical protein